MRKSKSSESFRPEKKGELDDSLFLIPNIFG